MEVVRGIATIWNGNATWQWAAADALVAAVFLGGLLARGWVKRRYALLSGTPEAEMMELPLAVANKTSTWFLVSAAVVSGLFVLALPFEIHCIARSAFTVVGCWQLGLWSSAAALLWLGSRRTHAFAGDRAAAGSLGVIRFVLWLSVRARADGGSFGVSA